MGRVGEIQVLFENSFPFVFFEADSPRVVGQEKRSFDELAVLAQQIDGVDNGHRRELVLDFEFSIQLARCVEQPTNLSVVVGEHLLELRFCRRFLCDIDGIVADATPIEPFEGFLAGPTLGVLINFHRCTFFDAFVMVASCP